MGVERLESAQEFGALGRGKRLGGAGGAKPEAEEGEGEAKKAFHVPEAIGNPSIDRRAK